MDFFERFPILSGAFFLAGLFLIGGGIRIIREQRFLSVSRYTSPEKWQKPVLVKGKGAIYHGVVYIVAGLLFVIGSIAVYSRGR